MPTVTAFRPEDLGGVLSLFEAEGWPSYTADAERTRRALSAPGSATLVARDGEEVVGVAQIQSDGEIQAHLSIIVVAAEHRRRGLGRTLLREALRESGALRVDAISTCDGFYEALGARRFPGVSADARGARTGLKSVRTPCEHMFGCAGTN